jgi:hypothetical protein
VKRRADVTDQTASWSGDSPKALCLSLTISTKDQFDKDEVMKKLEEFLKSISCTVDYVPSL